MKTIKVKAIVDYSAIDGSAIQLSSPGACLYGSNVLFNIESKRGEILLKEGDSVYVRGEDVNSTTDYSCGGHFLEKKRSGLCAFKQDIILDPVVYIEGELTNTLWVLYTAPNGTEELYSFDKMPEVSLILVRNETFWSHRTVSEHVLVSKRFLGTSTHHLSEGDQIVKNRSLYRLDVGGFTEVCQYSDLVKIKSDYHYHFYSTKLLQFIDPMELHKL